ncbi:hypothetical protein FOC1_g10009929 [Fusarium oxysporum f. sp. cubense race 1]|uniref:Uncharacterized protein n=1 Tax=Fusarium oxysporum f. sp. cubense (strain race 1) TaxID=1229664 RepID=N4UWF4_FUSC1|nr:hypothetical protein FOC1_g10009929 [Fusarium oxysporum f. sp. cubense race 1]
MCKRPKRFTQGPGDCDFRQHHPNDEREFNDFVGRVFGILKDLPRREKPYVEMIFEMSCSGFRVTFTQKGMQHMELYNTWKDFPELPMISVFRACGSTDTPTFTPGDICRLASKMPRLEKFGVRAIESVRDYVYGEAVMRNSLARSLDLIPMSVQTLLVDYQRERILDQTYNPPSIIPVESNREVLSEADISRAGFSFSTATGLMVLGKTDVPILSHETLEAWKTAMKTHDIVFDRCLTNELDVAGRYADEFGPEFQWDEQDVYLF